MTTEKTAEPHRLQPDPPEGDREMIERELAKQESSDSPEHEPTEQGVDLDPKRRID